MEVESGTASLFISLALVLSCQTTPQAKSCLLYTSDAADERSSVDLGGRRIIKKKTNIHLSGNLVHRIPNLSAHTAKYAKQDYTNHKRE